MKKTNYVASINLGCKLTSEQLRVIKESITGVNVVNAGPGCSKTTCLVGAANYIHSVTNGYCSILAFSYTRRTVAELAKKMSSVPTVTVKTFHAFFFMILRGYGYKSYEFIQNEAESRQIMKDVINKNELAEYVSIADVQDALTKDFYPSDKIKIAAELFLDELRSRRKFTFDSLQFEMLNLVATNKAAAARIQRMYTHVLIDEANDLSRILIKIVESIWKSDAKNNILIVGDPHQAIYQWRGSQASAMEEIEKYYTAKKHKLTRNFRCSSHDAIILANEIMPDAELRAELPNNETPVIFYAAENQQTEATYVCKRIHELVTAGATYKDILVLYRSSPAISFVYKELINCKIPFVKFGSDANNLLSNSRTKRIIGLLAYMHNQENTHWLRCAAPVFSIDAEILRDIVCDKNQSLPDALLICPSISKSSKRKFKAFIDSNIVSMPLRNQIIYLWDNFLKEYFGDDNDELLDSVLDAVQSFENYNQLRYHLEECRRQAKIMARLAGDINSDYLKLCSIHSSKGMEANHVIICGCADGLLPDLSHEESIDMDEERRLLYVAVTRAKQSLTITYPQSNKGHSQMPCRFIKDSFIN